MLPQNLSLVAIVPVHTTRHRSIYCLSECCGDALVVVFGGVLVHRSLVVMVGLFDLVLHGVAGGANTSRRPNVRIFGDLLVGLFAGGVGSSFGLVLEPVAGGADRVHVWGMVDDIYGFGRGMLEVALRFEIGACLD